MKENEFLSYDAISNVPLIKFPALSEAENITLHKMAMEVLATSKMKNKFNEVAITYRVDLDRNDTDAFRLILGTEGNVRFMADDTVRNIITNAPGLFLVNLHTSGGGFSVRDLLAFAVNSNIRVMEILTNKGEAAFLYRPYEIDIRNVVQKNINAYAPDLYSRITDEETDL